MIWRWQIWLALLLIGAQSASAHLTPNSVIALDFADNFVRATITIPTGELGYAYGKQRLSAAEFAPHLGVTAPDGRAWAEAVESIRYDALGGQTDFIARIKLTPPPGASTRKFSFHYDGVIDKVTSHIVLVTAQSDFSGGILQSEPAMLGGLQAGSATMAIDRGDGSRWRGFVSTVHPGMRHIAEGHDHLLFLLALLLPAPLVAAGGRWQGAIGARPTARRLLGIVTAFTIGHSITLIGGAWLGWRLNPQPVEIGIALSILISAIHALRPLYPGREALIAGCFGLIHGLAFATVIADFALDPGAKAIAILGFNVGIELVQLALLAVAVPLVLLVAGRTLYRPLRIVAALFTGAMALFWLAQRV